MFDEVKQYPMLREDQRIEARQKARANLLARLGGEPRFEDYERKQHSRFSPSMAAFVNRAMWGLLTAAFILSAIHIYFAASDAYGLGIKSPILRALGGVMFVVVAEIAAILFFTTPAVYEETVSGLTRWLSYMAGLTAGFVAIVFNIAVAIDYQSTPFDWLIAWIGSIATHPELFFVATVPPAFVLVVGQLQKTRILAENARRYSATIAHDAALAEWNTTLADIESHHDWSQAWASALWDVWAFRKRREVLADITPEEKRAIVQREMQADDWWNSGEFRPNSDRIQPNSSVSAKQRVIDYLRQNPELATSLNDGDIQQSEVAAQLGVSQASVSRGVTAYMNNGFH